MHDLNRTKVMLRLNRGKCLDLNMLHSGKKITDDICMYVSTRVMMYVRRIHACIRELIGDDAQRSGLHAL